MEDLLRPLYQERTSQQNTLGVLAVQKNEQNRAFTENFDSILLIIVKEAQYEIPKKVPKAALMMFWVWAKLQKEQQTLAPTKEAPIMPIVNP